MNCEDSIGNTPLHLACLNNQLDMVKILEQFGADPTIRNKSGEMALDLAIDNNNMESLTFLFSKPSYAKLMNEKLSEEQL